MGRPKKVEETQSIGISLEELQALRNKVAELEARVQVKSDPFEEIRKAKLKGSKGSDQISVRHFTDHKKVSLYHTNGYHIGKKVGPLHPGLLEQTFEEFKAKGIILSVNSPTPEEVSIYKNSAEYKKLEARQRELKPSRYRGETKDDVKRIAEAMTKIAGIQGSEVTIRPQEQVMKV